MIESFFCVQSLQILIRLEIYLKKFYKKTKIKIAIFGGSFNPPHISHLTIAKKIISLGVFYKVIIIPTFANPLKTLKPLTKLVSRQRGLILRTFGNLENTVIDWHNFYKNEASFAIDDIERIQLVYGSNFEITFFMGADAWQRFLEWKNYIEILKISKVAVFKRKGYIFMEHSQLLEYFNRFNYYDWDFPEVSSIQINKNLDDKDYLKSKIAPLAYQWLCEKNQ